LVRASGWEPSLGGKPPGCAKTSQKPPQTGKSRSFPNIAKPFRNVAKPFRNVAKPFRNVAKPFRNVAKPFRNVAKPFRNVAKPFRNVAKPFRNIAKRDFKVKNAFWGVEKLWLSDSKTGWLLKMDTAVKQG
jgi:hypothetical protein